MPIHGHTKIELTSQTTGEVETIEKDNIVTNAVSQIFNAFNGMASKASQPKKKRKRFNFLPKPQELRNYSN